MKVLYVEDNSSDIDLLKRVFKKTRPNIKLLTVSNIKEAKEKIETTEDLQLVIIDMKLPDGNGIDLLSYIRRENIALPVIILTGYGDEEAAVLSLKAGADDYIPKKAGYYTKVSHAIEKAIEHYFENVKNKGTRIKVLYVEHNRGDIDLTRRHFARYAPQIDLEFMKSAKELLDVIDSEEGKTAAYDVVLLDYSLPDMDSVEVLKTILSKRNSELPVIIVTGHGDEEAASQALQIGASDYIIKNQGYLFRLPVAIQNAYDKVKLMKQQNELIIKSEAKEKSEKTLIEAQKLAHVGSFELDVSSNRLVCSDEALDICGINRETFSEEPEAILRLIHLDDKQSVDQLSEKAIAEKRVVEYTCRIQRKDGDERTVNVRFSPTFNESGQHIQSFGTVQDITEKKRMEEELNYERDMAKMYLDTANIMFIAIDSDGTVVSINKKGCDILGYDEKDIIGENWFEKFLPNRIASEVRILFSKIISGEVDNVLFHENPVINSNGKERVISWHNALLKDKNGIINGVLSAGNDITEKKRAEEELIKSEVKYSSYIENAPDGVFIANERGKYVEVNKAASVITGYSKEELLNMSIEEILAEESVEEAMLEFGQLRKRGALHGTFLYKHKSGEKRWWTVDAVKISDTRFIGFSKDITEQKRAEERLAESEEKFRYVFDNSAIGKSLTLPSGEIRVNENFCNMMGYTKEELQDVKWQKITHPEDIERVQRELDKLLEGQENTVGFYKRYIKKDGSIVWADVRTTIRRDSEGKPMYFMTSILDITEQKKAEDALRESERSKDMLLSNLPGMAYQCRYDKEWTMKFLSTRCFELTGYKPESLIDNKELSYNEIIAPEYRDLVWSQWERVITQRGLFQFEYEIITAAGERKWVYEIGQGIFDEQGNVQLLEGIVLDIADRKKAEKALLKQEEEQRLLLEHLQVGIVVHNADSSILFSNHLAEEILGLPRDIMLSKQVSDSSWDFVNKFAEPLPVAEYPFSLVYDKRKTLTNYEMGIKYNSSQDIKWIMVNGFPMLDKDGNIEKVLISFIDITEKKKIEKNYEMIIKTAMDGFWLIDEEGHILEVNDSYCDLSGYTRKELLNMSIADVEVSENKKQVRERIKQVALKGPQRFETKHRCKNGQIVEVEISTEHLDGSNTNFVFIHDLTLRKKLEKNRLQLEAQLRNQQKLESIGTLASGVAHEINNPLNGILNYGQIILDANADNTSTKEYAKEIIRETNRISVIVKSLLDFSRQSKNERRYVKIGDIISQTLSLIKTILNRDKIELNLNIEDDLPDIKCDSSQIQQVVMNFITNARDALNQRALDFDKAISINCTRLDRNGEKWVELTFEDNGVGISEDVRSKIFDPFFTTKEKGKGTGLGLSISYGIIKEHHGEITVESELGNYSRFIIQLPCDYD